MSTMKIKVAYGVDMRLWKTYSDETRPDEATFTDLLSYIRQTFSFATSDAFRVTFKDDDDEMTTIASLEDLRDAFDLCRQDQKKSLKLHVVDARHQTQARKSGDNHSKHNDDEGQEQKSNGTGDEHKEDKESSQQPSQQEINAFLSDDLAMDLLSDLFVSVFEALQESQFEISFVETMQGVLLSSDAKYAPLTRQPVWPFFMQHLLPRHAPKIEQFVVPMMRMNGGVNAQAVKQYLPMMLAMMKTHVQNHHPAAASAAAEDQSHHPHPHPFHAFHHAHRGGRGAWRRPPPHMQGHPMAGQGACFRGWPWRGRGGKAWRARRGRGCGGAWANGGHAASQTTDCQQQSTGMESNIGATPDGGNFEYTEELVAIMNMGFGDIATIKRLLVEHKGNKENVVQELVLSSKK